MLAAEADAVGVHTGHGHRVIDSHSGGHRAAGTVDVDVDVLLPDPPSEEESN